MLVFLLGNIPRSLVWESPLLMVSLGIACKRISDLGDSKLASRLRFIGSERNRHILFRASPWPSTSWIFFVMIECTSTRSSFNLSIFLLVRVSKYSFFVRWMNVSAPNNPCKHGKKDEHGSIIIETWLHTYFYVYKRQNFQNADVSLSQTHWIWLVYEKRRNVWGLESMTIFDVLLDPDPR